MDFESSSTSQRSYNAIGSTKMHGCIAIGSNFDEMNDSYYDYYTR